MYVRPLVLDSEIKSKLTIHVSLARTERRAAGAAHLHGVRRRRLPGAGTLPRRHDVEGFTDGYAAHAELQSHNLQSPMSSVSPRSRNAYK